jgi:hypothetical protein
MYLRQLVDPAIKLSHLGPGFCTRDNLFGVGYLVLLVLNYALAIVTFYTVFGILRRFRWWRAVTGAIKHSEERLKEYDLSPEERAVARAEQGEGGWVVRKVRVFLQKGHEQRIDFLNAGNQKLSESSEREGEVMILSCHSDRHSALVVRAPLVMCL